MASGFCYLNDLVLACMRFLNSGQRVLYLDIEFFTMGLATTDCFVFIDMFDSTFQAGVPLLLMRKENL